jgi:hypothetical protein
MNCESCEAARASRSSGRDACSAGCSVGRVSSVGNTCLLDNASSAGDASSIGLSSICDTVNETITEDNDRSGTLRSPKPHAHSEEADPPYRGDGIDQFILLRIVSGFEEKSRPNERGKDANRCIEEDRAGETARTTKEQTGRQPQLGTFGDFESICAGALQSANLDKHATSEADRRSWRIGGGPPSLDHCFLAGERA